MSWKDAGQGMKKIGEGFALLWRALRVTKAARIAACRFCDFLRELSVLVLVFFALEDMFKRWVDPATPGQEIARQAFAVARVQTAVRISLIALVVAILIEYGMPEKAEGTP